MKKILLIFLLGLLFRETKSQSLLVNPNPFVNRSLVSYTLNAASTISIQISDATGQIVLTLRSNAALTAGSYQDSLIMDSFAPGIYYVAIRTGTQTLAVCKTVKTAATGIPHVAASTEIRIYPNPSTQTVRVELGTLAPDAKLILYDELGKVVYAANASGSPAELDLNSFTHGLYVLKLSDGAQEKTYRIVKE